MKNCNVSVTALARLWMLGCLTLAASDSALGNPALDQINTSNASKLQST
jgi:hypothetical protein